MNAKILTAAMMCLATGASATSESDLIYGTPKTLSIQSYSCAYATIMADDSVIIDWQCVQLQAMSYKTSRGRDVNATFAFVLESLRNGTAIAK